MAQNASTDQAERTDLAVFMIGARPVKVTGTIIGEWLVLRDGSQVSFAGATLVVKNGGPELVGALDSLFFT